LPLQPPPAPAPHLCLPQVSPPPTAIPTARAQAPHHPHPAPSQASTSPGHHHHHHSQLLLLPLSSPQPSGGLLPSCHLAPYLPPPPLPFPATEHLYPALPDPTAGTQEMASSPQSLAPQIPRPHRGAAARSIARERSPALCICALGLSAGTMNNEKLRGGGTWPAQMRLFRSFSCQALTSPERVGVGDFAEAPSEVGLILQVMRSGQPLPQTGSSPRRVEVWELLTKTAVRFYFTQTKTIFDSNLILRNH